MPDPGRFGREASGRSRRRICKTGRAGNEGARDMSTAIFPGSFDPPTHGHVDVIRRCAARFGGVVVCVMSNGGKGRGLFDVQERVELLRETTADIPGVLVEAYGGLLANYVRRFERPVIIRGLRATSDFDYEFQMASVNRTLNPEAETLFLAADSRYAFLSSSAARELGALGAELGSFVPGCVEKALRRKVAQHIQPRPVRRRGRIPASCRELPSVSPAAAEDTFRR